jgi:ribose 5-phosphate isomerase A
MTPDELKRAAALEAVELLESGMVVGLGTGSTVRHLLHEISRLIDEESLDILGIPTSKDTKNLALELGIPLTTLDDHPAIDLDIDGADEVDPRLDVIKGGGGAHVREKVVARASRSLVIIADESKLSDRIGTQSPVPVEVLPMAKSPVAAQIADLGGDSHLRMSGNGKTFVTDNGNFILDCKFGPIEDPDRLERRLKSITGVVDSGIFSGIAELAIIGTEAGTREIARDD